MSTRLSLLLASGLTLAAPAAYAETTQPTTVEHVQAVAPAAPTANRADSTRYAAREKTDTQAQSYEGGSVVVVGISGGAVLVLLILLILLV
jgi:hypothetical protein